MANRQIRIEAVLLDAKFTIFTARDMSRQQLLAGVVKEVTGVAIAAQELWREWRRIRPEVIAQFAAAQDSSERWVEENIRLLRSFGIEASPEQSLKIHRMIEEETWRYTLTPPRREFLEWLRNRKFPKSAVGVVTASNSPSHSINVMLKEHGIRPLFSHCYSPDTVGFSKPSPDFFRKILSDLAVQPSAALMIGNSPFSDRGAFDAGLHTVLILDKHEPLEVMESLRQQKMAQPSGVTLYSSNRIARVRRYIGRTFVAGSG